MRTCPQDITGAQGRPNLSMKQSSFPCAASRHSVGPLVRAGQFLATTQLEPLGLLPTGEGLCMEPHLQLLLGLAEAWAEPGASPPCP